MKIQWMVKLGLFLSVGLSSMSYADGSFAETTANAKIKVKAAISIAKNDDLLFTDATQGAPAQTLEATETGAARFTVTGQAGRTYSVSFPTASIDMKTGNGSTADEKIAVTNFTTNLTNNGGTLDGTSGTQEFRVGATRAALSNTQVVADNYTGVFTVRVTYN